MRKPSASRLALAGADSARGARVRVRAGAALRGREDGGTGSAWQAPARTPEPGKVVSKKYQRGWLCFLEQPSEDLEQPSEDRAGVRRAARPPWASERAAATSQSPKGEAVSAAARGTAA